MNTVGYVRLLRSLAGALTAVAVAMSLAVFLGLGRFGATEAAVTAVTGSSAIYFMTFFLLASTLLTLTLPAHVPRLILLLGVFPLLIGWRISVLADLFWIQVPCVLAFAVFVLLFLLIAVHDLRSEPKPGRIKPTLPYIQLAFIRLYIGLDLVPHFTEKLFAGPATRADDVQAFQQLGVPDPLQFVLLAGVIEFSAAFGVGLGFLTRTACILTVVYLMVATIMGHHFLLGFIWASPGGGWEYPLLWSVLILSFAIGSGRWMSLDEVLSGFLRLPRWVKALMGDTASHANGRIHISRAGADAP
ncbi:MAG: DoxX family protein [Pseudomonadota bacterium]